MTTRRDDVDLTHPDHGSGLGTDAPAASRTEPSSPAMAESTAVSESSTIEAFPPVVIHVLIRCGFLALEEDVSPPVWSADEQSDFMGSLFRQNVIPRIFLKRRQDMQQARPFFRLVSGENEQTVKAICNFFDGFIPIRDPVTGSSIWVEEAGKTPTITKEQKHQLIRAQVEIVFPRNDADKLTSMFSSMQIGA